MRRARLSCPAALEDTYHGRQDPNRTGSRGVPPAGRAPAFAHRRAEHRPDESRRLLPQLPVELDEGCGRRQGRGAEQGREARARVRHAVRRMEGEVPEGSLARAICGIREEPQALRQRLPQTRRAHLCPLPLWERASATWPQAPWGEGLQPLTRLRLVEAQSCPLPQGERA